MQVDVRTVSRHGLTFVSVNGRVEAEGFRSRVAATQRADSVRRALRGVASACC